MSTELIQDPASQFDEQGFALFRNVIDEDLIREAGCHVDWLLRKYPDLRPENLHHPLMRDDAFWLRLVTDDRLLDIVERFLGPDLSCFTAHYICKPPSDGMAVLWHQDGAYWKLQPMEALTVWLAIDHSEPENGCLQVFPGSHRLPLQTLQMRHDPPNMLCSSIDPRFMPSSTPVDIVLSPGDVSVHHPHIVHGSGPNQSPRRRCGLDIGFIPTRVAVTNPGLYLNPILARGKPVAGVNQYRAWPEYSPDMTISFRGWQEWNERATGMNQRFSFRQIDHEDVLSATRRMIQRLQDGTVKG